MDKVRDILNKKGGSFYFVHPGSFIFDALQTMADKDIGAVMVIQDEQLVGMFTERDYARKIVLHGHTSKSAMVGDFMTKTVLSVQPDTSLNECMELMSMKRIRHLPVTEGNKVLGIISIGDVVNYIIQQQDTTIRDLQNYIYGGHM